jgi:HEAT repeat protein
MYAAREQDDRRFLIRALSDPEHRRAAARFLADLGAIEAIPEIERLLDASDAGVRRTASRTLGQLRAVAALPKLREVAADDVDPVTRSWAIAALGAIGGEHAVGDIAVFLNDPDWFVRRAAAFSLGVLGAAEGLPILARARKKERWTHRREFRKAARRIKTGTAVDIGPKPFWLERYVRWAARNRISAEDAD